jgi:hypothetical protein
MQGNRFYNKVNDPSSAQLNIKMKSVKDER